MPIGMPTDRWKTWCPKTTYTDIVYKKAKHTLKVFFGILVWAIKLVSNEILYIRVFPRHVFPRESAQKTVY
jgi:hypothetical protein